MSDQEDFERVKPLLSVRDEPAGTIYTPPDGQPVDNEGIYLPDDPSVMTDRLVNWERRFLLPLAQIVSRVFRVLPITDDVYRTLPQDTRNSVLCVVLSRSEIQQVAGADAIRWPAIRVVVKQYEVVRINVVCDFSRKVCDVEFMDLWRNAKPGYERIIDPNGRAIGPQTIYQILTRYAAIEGILPSVMIPSVR